MDLAFDFQEFLETNHIANEFLHEVCKETLENAVSEGHQFDRDEYEYKSDPDKLIHLSIYLLYNTLLA